ncbi:MAG: Hpt domain-containing protein [Vulcanimicrobiota bacterium]
MDASPQGPPLVAGLDTARALARLGIQPAVYVKMLSRFLDFASLPEDIERHLAAGDWSGARRLAHTLKGVAGSLGADSLQQEAAEVEATLARQVAPQLTELSGQLSRLVLAVREALPLSSPPADRLGDADDFSGLALRMCALLEAFDCEASQLFDARRQAFARLLGQHDRDFQECMDQYSYEQALELLRRALAEGEEGLP